jgi:hypothetical protein
MRRWNTHRHSGGLRSIKVKLVLAWTRLSPGAGVGRGYASKMELGGSGSVLRLIFEPSSPQGSSHNPQFTVARRLAVTNGT